MKIFEKNFGLVNQEYYFYLGKAKLSIKISSIKQFFVLKKQNKNMNIFFFIFLNSANFAEPENTNLILFAFKPKLQNE